MELLDHAALEVDALVDEGRQARHALAILRVAAQARLEPREVHLRGREDAAQLVMELAGKARLFPLVVRLQESGERGELARAPTDVAQHFLLLSHERGEIFPLRLHAIGAVGVGAGRENGLQVRVELGDMQSHLLVQLHELIRHGVEWIKTKKRGKPWGEFDSIPMATPAERL